MRVEQHARTLLTDLTRSHRGGHRCEGEWYNENAGPRTSCPTMRTLTQLADAVETLHQRVHAAAHDTPTAVAVAEGMTGLTMAELNEEEAQGWTQTARMAIEALAAHLDRDPALEARAAAVQARLASSGGGTVTSLARGPEEAATCAHGLLVGLDNTTDPRECQSCDWCPRCEEVREWENETCKTCGRVWGACEECNSDPCIGHDGAVASRG